MLERMLERLATAACADKKKSEIQIRTQWKEKVKYKLGSEILGSSKASFSKFVLCTQKLSLVFCQLPRCIISLMKAQKHVFGTYVFVYLAICIFKVESKSSKFHFFALFSPVHIGRLSQEIN